ncbi:MAG: class I SAM-dependent RNA methyltransferase [Hyphomicrobiales bacterium]
MGPRGPLYVPFALPGEEVTAEPEAGRLKLVSIERESPDRVAPICRYFGECGGCKLQHWRREPYLAWKRDLVVEALASRGLEAPVSPTLDAHGSGRRRVTFHARREGRITRTGFMRAASHVIVAIDTCPILAPSLAAAPRIAAECAEILAKTGKPLDIGVTATEAGLDLSFKGHGPLDAAAREAMVGLAERHDVARLCNHHELIVERRPPFLMIAGCQMLTPPGAFLQATLQGEETLAQLAVEALAGARRIADLFCGIGPFALRLARTAQIFAFDSDAAAVAALTKAAQRAQGLKPLKAEARDLFRRPLLAAELGEFDAVILDPPRQGAEAQTRQLARSGLKRIVYVSCDPSSFARDAATLVQAGYKLEPVTPVDQFRFSAHVELVGVFLRPK